MYNTSQYRMAVKNAVIPCESGARRRMANHGVVFGMLDTKRLPESPKQDTSTCGSTAPTTPMPTHMALKSEQVRWLRVAMLGISGAEKAPE
jgi:hypothetical protein